MVNIWYQLGRGSQSNNLNFNIQSKLFPREVFPLNVFLSNIILVNVDPIHNRRHSKFHSWDVI